MNRRDALKAVACATIGLVTINEANGKSNDLDFGTTTDGLFKFKEYTNYIVINGQKSAYKKAKVGDVVELWSEDQNGNAIMDGSMEVTKHPYVDKKSDSDKFTWVLEGWLLRYKKYANYETITLYNRMFAYESKFYYAIVNNKKSTFESVKVDEIFSLYDSQGFYHGLFKKIGVKLDRIFAEGIGKEKGKFFAFYGSRPYMWIKGKGLEIL